MRKRRRMLAAFLMLVLLLSPVVVLGQEEEGLTFEDLPGAEAIFDIFDRVLDWLFTFSLFIMPIVVVIAGFIFLTAGGDPNRLSLAKKMLIWALIGFVVILIAGGADDVLQDILGIGED